MVPFGAEEFVRLTSWDVSTRSSRSNDQYIEVTIEFRELLDYRLELEGDVVANDEVMS